MSSSALQLSDCDPHVSAQTFDHNTTSTSFVCLVADVPYSPYRHPSFCTFSFLNCDLSLPFRAQVRQVVGLVIVLPKNMHHVVIDLSHWRSNFPPPQRMQCPLNTLHLFSVLWPHRTSQKDPLLHNFALHTLVPWYLLCEWKSMNLAVPIS